MKVKNQHSEYNDWKTLRQWNLLGKTFIDKSKIEEMWANQNTCSSFGYFEYCSPENVRDMTNEELLEFKNSEKQKRKQYRQKQKLEKEHYQKQLNYANELRENWHTEWQWLRDYRRIVNNGATWKDGESLNERIDWYLFGSDYCYFNIKDTTLITDDEEYKRLVDESNKRYNERISSLDN